MRYSTHRNRDTVKDELPTCLLAIVIHADPLDVDVINYLALRYVICGAQKGARCCLNGSSVQAERSNGCGRTAKPAAFLRKADLYWLLG